ncbi:flagellar basal-body MS-ring/collar protein FliF [Bordetella sp. 15P40C-2]|uniref:flagellar basal-body MS-ring/collar protein FliF n=1 Tax=Bordetella sp. 15P40C-2 TaxID=2572246 RepID=UPI00132331D3|nr:flagellar basal-body MS-ring/collar protein FliF [Bordetella sp. 15P40C-2]MVW69953.1 flagellar basal body M-ring protein FliF [Bordetella sp. 15P40C-2]
MSRFQELTERFPVLKRVAELSRPVQLAGASALVALFVGAAIAFSSPDYKVLFSNLGDKDGGAIVSALDKLQVPHRFSDNGGAILVPADKVHEARMKLAEQGLPQGGNVGFELMESPKFGASQFAEQVTYQRAIEGELARSIEAMTSVETTRVHLAIPKQTLFVRERKQPTASVLLTLSPGRMLGDGQIAAIAWLVASSVPDLTPENVSIVDQTGRLLSSKASLGGLGANETHLRYTSELEQRTASRVLSILTPIVGAGNVHTEVSALLDFSVREQTSETYRPNQKPELAAVRSEQTNNSAQRGVLPAMGVPGALANEPPPAPAAAVVAPQNQQNADTQERGPSSTNMSSTVNYEVDRTISHIKESVGQIKRLSVAVVVNYRTDEEGKLQPLDATEIEQIQHLVKEAIGYSETRGDTLKVANVPFNNVEPALPVWKDPFYLDLARTAAQYLALALLLAFLWFKIVKPLMRARDEAIAPLPAVEITPAPAETQKQIDSYEDNLNAIREIAKQDPRAVSMVIRNWINDNDE